MEVRPKLIDDYLDGSTRPETGVLRVYGQESVTRSMFRLAKCEIGLSDIT